MRLKISKAGLLAASALVLVFGTQAFAEEAGSISKAVGGYTFDQAAKEAPGTKNFHSADGHLTFAIITHTAGNGFFDPVYVGAKVAADAFGINLLMLGSEAPIDDIPRELEILNQAIQDPTIDGFIFTTPQSGAYDDIVKKLESEGVPVATTNSFDPKLYDRSNISHTGQNASAAMLDGQALAKCLIDRKVKGGSVIFPNYTQGGNVEVNNRTKYAFEGTVKALKDAGVLDNFKVDAGPANIGIDVDLSDPTGSVSRLIESRGDVVGAFMNDGVALGNALSQLSMGGKVCAFSFDIDPKRKEFIKEGVLTGSLGQQPFLQGFWPVMQLYLQIDRGVTAADLDTKGQLVTKANVDKVGTRYEN